MALELKEAYQQIRTLKTTLDDMVKRDPEQEVRAIAIPVVDRVLVEAKALLPDHPIVSTIRDVISPEQIESDEPIRAADFIHVVNALFVALSGPYADWVNEHPTYIA